MDGRKCLGHLQTHAGKNVLYPTTPAMTLSSKRAEMVVGEIIIR